MADRVDPQREPSADIRVAARAMREIFTSLLNEGFTEDQALKIIGIMLAQAKEQQ
jgi:hypothetical protein